MKVNKFIIFVLFFALNGWANGCGSNSLIADFSKTAKAGGNTEFQQTFSGFHCPPVTGRKPEAIILNDINFETGEYQCEYAFEQEITEKEKADKINKGELQHSFIEDKNQGINYKNNQCAIDKNYFLKTILENNKSFSIKPTPAIEHFSKKNHKANYIGLFPVTGLKSGLFWDTTVEKLDLDLARIRGRINDIKTAEKSTKGMSIQKKHINTNLNNKNHSTFSVAEYFAGAITLNPDIFNEQRAIVDDTGSISLKGQRISTFDKLSWFGLGTTTQEMINPIDSVIDGKFWGFFVSFIENIRLAEHNIILMLFSFGFVTLVGQKSISGFYSSFGDNQQEKVSNLGISKMIVSPVLSLVFFTAPIIPSNLELPNQFIKESSMPPSGIILNASADNNSGTTLLDKVGNSTIIQTAIRHFVTWGTLSANELADYALYPYLNYLEMRQGAVFGVLSQIYSSQYANTAYQFKKLEKAVHFYEGFCKPIYKSDNESAAVLLASPILGKQPTTLRELTQHSYNNSEFRKTFGFDTVSAELCSNLEFQIGQLTQQAFVDYVSLDGATAGSMKYVEKIKLVFPEMYHTETVRYFNNNDLINTRLIAGRMIAMQEASGWIFSALVPIGYILTQTAAVAETIEDKQEIARKFSASAGFRQNQINSGNVVKNKGEEDTGVKQWIAEFLTMHLSYFMLPKFTELYKVINDLVESTASIIGLIVGLFTTAALSQTTPLNFVAAPIIGFIVGVGLKAFSGIAAYFISIFIYNYFIKILVLTAVMSMALFKIAMYYIEVLVFFVMSPAVVIWAVVSKKSEVIWHYIGKGAVLTVMPIIIVLSCYLFIFASETLITLYSYLSGLVAGIFVNGKTSFMTSVSVYSTICLGNGIVLGANVFIGYITIIKASQWFLETVGAKASVMDNFAGEMGQKAEKYVGVL